MEKIKADRAGLTAAGGEAVITRGVGGKYRLHLGGDHYITAVPRGILRRKQQRPLPGDRVIYSWQQDRSDPVLIESVFARQNLLVRPPLANVDCLILTVAVARPEPDLLLLDKLLVITATAGIDPLICFTKGDLDRSTADRLASFYRLSGYRTAVTSLTSQQGLLAALPERSGSGRIIALAGPSGTGKSTLFNALAGSDLMATGGVSHKTGRGRHTTRHVELWATPTGCYLTDTPGFSSLDLAELGIPPEDVVCGYREFMNPATGCRFNTCRHRQEPGCAVTEFVAEQAACDKALYNHLRERLARYRILYESAAAVPPHIRRQRRR